MKAAIYCRISLDRTGEELGVTRQLEDCRALAATLGWPIVETFIDNDISASSGKLRPDYRRMLESITAGEIEAIIAWHPDRLYRKLRDLEELIEACEKNAVTIRTVRAGEFDLSTPTGKMLARILASVSAGEGDIKADRWKRSVRQRREAGHAPKMGGRLFGYTADEEIEPDEAAVIREVAEAIIDGEPMMRVLNQLNARGIRTSRGNQWQRSTLIHLLQNGRIAGRSVLRGDTLGVGQWPAILSEDTFEELQAALARRTSTTNTSARVSLLVGMVVCGKCGANLVTARRYRSKEGAPAKRAYRCRRMPGKDVCGGVSADAEAVETIVETYAREKLSDPRVLASLRALSETSAGNAGEMVALEQRLVELEAELDTPGVPVAAILRAMDRTRERLGELHATNVASVPAAPLRGEWPPDLGRRAKLIRLVVKRVVVNPGPAVRRTFDPERVVIEPR